MASESLWHQNAALFRRLYIEENKTLKEVKSEAEEAHGFPCNSLSAYETKLREVLGLRKNLTPAGWRAIGQQISRDENRQWEVYIHGRKVTKSKVMKEIGRYAKHVSPSSGNLPMPQEARIKWICLPSPRSTNRPIGGLHPRQMMIPMVSGSEDVELIDYTSTLPVRSSTNILHATKFVSYNLPVVIDQTMSIAIAARKHISTRFDAAILDPHLKQLWDPMLNNLPFFPLTQMLEWFRVHGNSASPLSASMMRISQPIHTLDNLATQSNTSLRRANLEEIADRSGAVDSADHTHELPMNGTLSIDFDPFRILGLLIYHFSNHLEGLEQAEETMRFLVKEVPLNFVCEVLQAGSPSIQGSWMQFAEWSFELGEIKFFEQVMQVSLRYPEWIRLNGDRCLVFAANLGCFQVVRAIIECHESPNNVSEFSVSYKHSGATPGFSRLAAVGLHRARSDRARSAAYNDMTVLTCPLLEAAVKGRHNILGILKDAHVDVQLRLDGLTIAGHVISAHQDGLIDMDDLSSTLSFLVSMGENVDAPMCLYEHEGMNWSEETLLDAVYLTARGSDLFKEFEKISEVPHCVLTVSGILQSAEDGQDALRRYLTRIRYPIGYRRKLIEEIALVRSFYLPKAFETMMGVGFALETKTLQGANRSSLGDWCAQTLSFYSPHDWILRELSYFPTPVVQYIVDKLTKDKLFSCDFSTTMFPPIAALVPKLSADQIQRLGTELLASAMKHDDCDAVQACLKAGVRVGEISILALAESGELDHSALRVLHDHGARLAFSPQDLKCVSLDVFSIKMLRWLIARLSDINGKETCDIVTQFLVDEVNWKDPVAFQQWLADSSHDELFGYGGLFGHRNRLLFNSEEAKKYKDSTSTFLALMICLGRSFNLILKLFDEGVDLNSRNVMNPIKKKSTPDEEYYSMHKAKEPPYFHVQGHQSKLEDAIQNHDTPMVQALLDCIADINHCNDIGRTTLEFAVDSYMSDYEEDCKSSKTIIGKQLVVMLLENGADPNFEYYDTFGKVVSPSLMRAVESIRPDLHLIQLLLEKGACIDADYERWCSNKDRDDCRPCNLISHVLADECKDLQLKKEIFALLLASGAQYDKQNGLRIAVNSGDIELVRFHLENGADPNPPTGDHQNYNPLEESAGAGNIPLALMLLAAGATLSVYDHALSAAARNGRLDMVALLLPHENCLEEVESALKWAEAGRFYSIVQLLRQAKTNWEA